MNDDARIVRLLKHSVWEAIPCYSGWVSAGGFSWACCPGGWVDPVLSVTCLAARFIDLVIPSSGVAYSVHFYWTVIKKNYKRKTCSRKKPHFVRKFGEFSLLWALQWGRWFSVARLPCARGLRVNRGHFILLEPVNLSTLWSWSCSWRENLNWGPAVAGVGSAPPPQDW